MIDVKRTNEKIRKMRYENDVSVDELALALNVSKTTVYKWETYNLPNLDNLLALSKYFCCTVEDLVAYE